MDNFVDKFVDNLWITKKEKEKKNQKNKNKKLYILYIYLLAKI